MSRYVLEPDDDVDFSLIGIASHARAYKLCWAINQALELALEKSDKVLYGPGSPENPESEHDVYQCQWEEYKTQLYLICNESGGRMLLPELKHARFLLMVASGNERATSHIKSALNGIAIVMTCFNLPVKDLKSKENLMIL